jgi:predicted HTH domain antitoxin
MTLKKIEIDFPMEVLDSLTTTYQNSADALKEAAVLELYREGKLSSGMAGEILGMERFEFIRYAGSKGIPYIRMTPEELSKEVKGFERLS